MVVLSFHNIFERLFETLSSQVKIHLQLREEDGVLRSILEKRELLIDLYRQCSSLHTLSNGSQVLLTYQIYKHYGHFLIKNKFDFIKGFVTDPCGKRACGNYRICICCQVTAKLFILFFFHLNLYCDVLFLF